MLVTMWHFPLIPNGAKLLVKYLKVVSTEKLISLFFITASTKNVFFPQNLWLRTFSAGNFLIGYAKKITKLFGRKRKKVIIWTKTDTYDYHQYINSVSLFLNLFLFLFGDGMSFFRWPSIIKWFLKKILLVLFFLTFL